MTADMKDMVVILPGILGSVLQKDGKDLWNVSGQAIWQVAKSLGNRLQDLKLEGDDPDIEDLKDGIKATEIMSDAHLIPGLWKIDGYTKTSQLITDNFAVTKGNIYNDPEDKAANFYHFPYDWRRDNRANAKILKRLLDKRLKTWREHSGNSNAKVILLAHSMGGLISRYYLEVLGGWQDCKALFTFGTPYRGSLTAVNFLANSYQKKFLGLTYLDLTEVMRSLTSVYQLLPRYRVLKIGDNFYRIAESPVDLPNIDIAKAKDALNFHNEIDDAADANKDDSIYRNSFVTCPIVGVVQPTLQSAELADGVITVSEVLPTWLSDRSHFAEGDGTVPRVSATPVQMNDIEVTSGVNYIAEAHGALQNQPNILENVRRGIEALQSGAAQDARSSLETVPRRRSEQTGVGLSLEDIYWVKEPIAMRAKVSRNVSFDSLTATISCVSHNRPAIACNFTNENGNWNLTTDALEAGLYKVKVQTDNTSANAPNPVHDLFEVADFNAGV